MSAESEVSAVVEFEEFVPAEVEQFVLVEMASNLRAADSPKGSLTVGSRPADLHWVDCRQACRLVVHRQGWVHLVARLDELEPGRLHRHVRHHHRHRPPPPRPPPPLNPPPTASSPAHSIRTARSTAIALHVFVIAWSSRLFIALSPKWSALSLRSLVRSWQLRWPVAVPLPLQVQSAASSSNYHQLVSIQRYPRPLVPLVAFGST